ncbi:MAG: sensor histidine kinase [Polaromonas sp.]
MKLSQFIAAHLEQILAEWESFARTLDPSGHEMSSSQLRENAEGMLRAIAHDIECSQSEKQQIQKSKSQALRKNCQKSAAFAHGASRLNSNFSLPQLSAEFRALRAAVLRLWLPRVRKMSDGTIHEMIRFNEGIDQALAESIAAFTTAADEARDLFLAILGHDLRGPLAAITITSELLMRTQGVGEEVMADGRRINRSARYMNNMIKDLIEYSRTQPDRRISVTRSPADIAEICRAALENASATSPDCQFDFDADPGLGGSFDSDRLYQLFSNLFINAAQYGARDCPVIVRASGVIDLVTIQVTNFGSSISDALLQSMFKPLIQLPANDDNESRPQNSLGLGLFIAREIAVAHGGAIDVKLRAAGGTEFTVSLPRGVAPTMADQMGR